MTKDEDKLKKFLASDDLEMVRMGIALAKGMGVKVTAEMLDIPLKSKNAEIVESGVMLAKEEGMLDEVLKRLASEAGIVDEALDGPIPIHGGVLRITKDEEDFIFNSWEEIDNLAEKLYDEDYEVGVDAALKLEKIGWPAQRVVVLGADIDRMARLQFDLYGGIESILGMLYNDKIWNYYRDPISTQDAVVDRLGDILYNDDLDFSRRVWNFRLECVGCLERIGTMSAIGRLVVGLRLIDSKMSSSGPSISTYCVKALISIAGRKENGKPAIENFEEIYSKIVEWGYECDFDATESINNFMNLLKQAQSEILRRKLEKYRCNELETIEKMLKDLMSDEMIERIKKDDERIKEKNRRIKEIESERTKFDDTYRKAFDDMKRERQPDTSVPVTTVEKKPFWKLWS